jgi:SAM-dependent methyltransferase
MSYKQRAAERIAQVTDLAGKRVLEVGGGFQFEAARAFLERGAESVTVTNIGHGLTKAEPEPGISVCYADATRLSEFVEGPFDVIFGTAVIEHIPQTARWLAETDQVLGPGGFVYYSGGPIWTCAAGHHIWVNSGGREYRFTRVATNPIPSWGHLLYSRDALKELLLSKGVPDQDVAEIDRFVFDSFNINRVTHGEIRRCFAECAMDIVDITEKRREISEHMKRLLEEKVGPESDYGVSGIEFILKKME